MQQVEILSQETQEDLACWQKLATYRQSRSQVTPLNSEVNREVFPCKPEEIHDHPSPSVAVDLVRRV